MYAEIFDVARAIHRERIQKIQPTSSWREAVAGSQPQPNLYRWLTPIRENFAVHTRWLTVRTRGQRFHRYVAAVLSRVHRPETIRGRSTS